MKKGWKRPKVEEKARMGDWERELGERDHFFFYKCIFAFFPSLCYLEQKQRYSYRDYYILAWVRSTPYIYLLILYTFTLVRKKNQVLLRDTQKIQNKTGKENKGINKKETIIPFLAIPSYSQLFS